jgi:eukaryotic-like serine/threonine-protein kinase
MARMGLTGQTITLLERVAQGGMAEVYRAKLEGIGGFRKTVAVKRVLPAFSMVPQFKSMFLAETRLSAELHHPNIVQVYSNGEDENGLFLVMEYIRGVSLRQLLDRVVRQEGGRLPPVLACRIVAEAAQGLHFAHTLKNRETGVPLRIVHRDLSPQNVMVSYEGHVKVVDFGIAKAADQVNDLTKTGEVKGKTNYMAPEQFDGRTLDATTDIWGLGMVLYELLVGHNPFKGDSPGNTVRRILSEAPQPPSQLREDVPPDLDAVVGRCLQKDPKARFASAGELHRALSTFVAKHHPGFEAADVADYLGSHFQEEASRQEPPTAEVASPSLVMSSQVRIAPKDTTTGSRTRQPPVPMAAVAAAKTSGSRGMGIAAVVSLLVVAGVAVAIGLRGTDKPPPPVIAGPPAAQPALAPAGPPPPADDAEEVAPALAGQPYRGLDGVTAWWEPAKATLKDGILVWPEASGRGHTAISMGAPPEVFKLGRSTLLHFDGVNDYLVADEVVAPVKASRAITTGFVARPEAVPDLHGYVWAAHQADMDKNVVRVGFGESRQLRIAVASAKKNLEGAPPDNQRLRVYVVVFSGDELHAWVDGRPEIAMSTDHGDLSKVGKFVIGQEYDKGIPSDFFKGDLGDLVLFDRALTDPERKTLESVLARRYGIRLPGMAPKGAPPATTAGGSSPSVPADTRP